jgi:hypothetical protein
MNIVKTAKYLIACFFNLKVRISVKKKVKKIIRFQAGKTKWAEAPRDVSRKYKELWKKSGYKADKSWLKMYGNICGDWDYRFIPESIYYLVAEPCLNNKSFSKSFSDKNLYSLFLKGFNRPETIVSNIEDVFYDAELVLSDDARTKEAMLSQSQIIIKPATDSGGGKDVTLWSVKGDKLISGYGEAIPAEELLKRYKRNFVIQKVIEQHPFYKRFNSSSVNTVRILTYRSPADEKIHILHTVFRVGSKDSITDNQASGGFACGVTDDGRLTGFAVDKKGNRYSEVNSIILEKGLKLEGYDELSATAIKAASRFYYSRLLGFDLCIDKDNQVIIIEVNNMNNEINFFQMIEGPLFGEFTEEVAEWCGKHKRSFMIDYDI